MQLWGACADLCHTQQGADIGHVLSLKPCNKEMELTCNVTESGFFFFFEGSLPFQILHWLFTRCVYSKSSPMDIFLLLVAHSYTFQPLFLTNH